MSVINNFDNLLLIDSYLKDYNIFIESCNSNTLPIIYTHTTFSSDLLNYIITKEVNFKRLGIVFSNTYGKNSSFLDADNFFDDTFLNINTNTKFIIDLIKHYKIKNIDFFGCNTLKYDTWHKYYKILQEQTGVTIGASDNITGNLKYGGDWILETTNEDIETIYFNTNIKHYSYLLDAGLHGFIIDNNSKIYAAGVGEYGNLGLGNFAYTPLFQQLSSNFTSKPKYICTNRHYSLLILQNGLLYGCGVSYDGALGLGPTQGMSLSNSVTTFTQISIPNNKKVTNVTCGAGFNDVGMNTIIVNEDGDLYGSGYISDSPIFLNSLTNSLVDNVNVFSKIPLPSGKKAKQVSSGNFFIMVVMTDGTLYSVGYNRYGQLGLGFSSFVEKTFKQVNTLPSGTLVKYVSCGSSHTIILTTNNEVYLVGRNNYGQIGNNDGGYGTDAKSLSWFKAQNYPTTKTPKYVCAQNNRSFILMTDGTLYISGSGEVYPDSSLSSITNFTQYLFKSPIQNIGVSDYSLKIISNKKIYSIGTTDNGVSNQRTNFTELSTPILDPQIFSNSPKLSLLDDPQLSLGDDLIILKEIGDPDFTLSAISYSNSPITYSIVSQPPTKCLDIVNATSGLIHLGNQSGDTIINAKQNATSVFSEGSTNITIRLLPGANLRFSSGNSVFKGKVNLTFNLGVLSNSSGKYTYLSDDPSYVVVDINTGDVTILKTTNAPVKITIIQEATLNYKSNTITATVSSLLDPTITYLNGSVLTGLLCGNTMSILVNSTSNGTITATTDILGYISVNTATLPPTVIANNAYNGDIIITFNQAETNTYLTKQWTYTIRGIGLATSYINLGSPTTYNSLACGNTFLINVTGGTGNGIITYSSSDSTYASVDASGNVKCLKASSTPIYIYINKAATSFYAAVTKSIKINSIAKGTTSISFFAGYTTLPILSANSSYDLISNSYITSNGDGSFIYTVPPQYSQYIDISSSGVINTKLVTNSPVTFTIQKGGTSNFFESNIITGTIPFITSAFANLHLSPVPPSFTYSGYKVNDTFPIQVVSDNIQTPFTYLTNATNISISSSGIVTILAASNDTAKITINQSSNGIYGASQITAFVGPTDKGIPIITQNGSSFTNGSSNTINGKKVNDEFNLNIIATNVSDYSFTYQVITSGNHGVIVDNNGLVKLTKTFSSPVEIEIRNNTHPNYVDFTAKIIINTIGLGNNDITATFINNGLTSIDNISVGNNYDISILSSSSGTLSYSFSQTGYFNIVNYGTQNGTVTTVVPIKTYVGQITLTISQSSDLNVSNGQTTVTFNNIIKGDPHLYLSDALNLKFMYLIPVILDLQSLSDGAYSFNFSSPSFITLDTSNGDYRIIPRIMTNSPITMTITQAATQNYNQATYTLQFIITKADPIITVDSLFSKTLLDIRYPFSLGATINVSGSNLLTYSLVEGSSQYLSVNRLTGIANVLGYVGTGYINITYAGNTYYNAKTITVTVNITKVYPRLIFNRQILKTLKEKDPFEIPILSNSDGNISYSIDQEDYNSNNVANITDDGKIILKGTVGTVNIKITQAESRVYESFSDICTITVNKSIPKIMNLPETLDIVYTDTMPVSLDPIFESTGGLIYTASDDTVANALYSNNDMKYFIYTYGKKGDSIILLTQYPDNDYYLITYSIRVSVTNLLPNLKVNGINGTNTFKLIKNNTLDLQQYITTLSDGIILFNIDYNGNSTSVATISNSVLSGLDLTTNPIKINIIQQETSLYVRKTIQAIVNIKPVPINPTIKTNIPTKGVLTAPKNLFKLVVTSNSLGLFTYTVKTSKTISIDINGVIKIIKSGKASLQITQAEYDGFNASTKIINFKVKIKK